MKPLYRAAWVLDGHVIATVPWSYSIACLLARQAAARGKTSWVEEVEKVEVTP